LALTALGREPQRRRRGVPVQTEDCGRGRRGGRWCRPGWSLGRTI